MTDTFLGAIDELYVGYGLISAAALISLAYALTYGYRHRRALFGAEGVMWILNGAVFVMLLAPMLLRFTMPEVWTQYITNIPRLSTHLPFLPVVFAVIAVWTTGCRAITTRNLSHALFITVLLLPLFLVSRCVYLYLVDPELYSDFKVYWELACRSGEEGRILTKSDTALSPEIYLRRLLPLWSPLVLLFGSSPVVYKTANVVLQLLIYLMTYRLAYLYFGRRPAQLTVWTALFIPELLYSCGIVTHDLAGCFFLLAFLTSFDLAFRHYMRGSLSRAALLGVVAGAFWVLVEFQRTLGMILTLAMFMACLAMAAVDTFSARASSDWRRGLRAGLSCMAILFVVPLATMKLSLWGFDKAGVFSDSGSDIRWIYGHTSVDNWDGGYYGYVALIKHFDELQKTAPPGKGAEFWAAFYGNSFISEYIHNHLRYVPQLMVRNRVLMSLGDSDAFYFSRLKTDSIVRPGSDVIIFFQFMTDLFMLVFLVFGSLYLIRFLKNSSWQIEMYPPLLILSVLVTIVWVLGEPQARHYYPFWFILTIFIGPGLAQSFSRSESGLAPTPSRLLWGVAISVCVLSSSFLAGAAAYSISDSKLIYMRGWTIRTSEGNEGARNVPGLLFSNNNVRQELVLPRKPQAGDWTGSEKILQVRHAERVYVLRGIVQCPFTGEGSGLDSEVLFATVYINDEARLTLDFTEVDMPRFIEIPGVTPGPDGTVKVAFALIASKAYEGDNWEKVAQAHFSRFQLVPES